MAPDQQLADILSGCSDTFKPYACLHKASDSLTVYFKGDADYSKRLTDHVTLYLSLDNDEIVGCRIKGISGILEDLPNFIHVTHDGSVNLSEIFLAFLGATEDEDRSAIKQLGSAARERRMTVSP
mgnify:CR=1 FL=1